MSEDPAAPTEEQKAVEARRAALGDAHDAGLPFCGLALSGGGIRSATFCLGLIRALAANGVLRRFDYLSTVSGGGYAGAALGRLYRPGTSIHQVESGLASDGSLLLWWLRSNGRYLIPTGLRDLLQAAAFQLRGFLATQFEAAVIALLIASVVVLPHMLTQWLGLPLRAREWLEVGGTLWWSALPLPVLGAVAAIVAYWFSRDERDGGRRQDPLLSLALLAVALLLLVRMQRVEADGPDAHFQLAMIGGIVAVLLCVPLAYVMRRLRRSVPAAEDRIVYTGWLSWMLALAAAILAFGLLDLLSWVAAWLWLFEDDLKVSGGAGFAVVALLIARALLPALQKIQRSTAGGLPLDRLANLAGLLLIGLLTLLWLTLLQAFVFLVDNGPALQALLAGNANSAAARWIWVLGLIVVYILCTLWNLPQLNRSSLHEFYRSRLARTYVSVGNYRTASQPASGERFPDLPLVTNNRQLTQDTEKVTRLLRGDDVALGRYQPHAAGGPIHLVNCCINQTRDDRTGSYNADRKGIALTVSSLGLETGTHGPVPLAALADTPLSQWIAISGAAVSSGMGSQTRPGTSALLFLSGLRLGYWWRSQSDRRFSKYLAVLSEMFARFPGLRSPAWYVSDGGHFDNTGVYALLKRRLPLIVLADCGADPRYLFADLENLVRKARLDYAADIEFIDPAAIPDPDVKKLLGTPDSIGPEPGDEYLLLARIRYSGGDVGTLLVVKPRRLRCLPLDVIGYSDRDPLFPQQTTGDQFFDEAQWESYQALGNLLGAKITAQLLSNLPGWVASATAVDVASVTPHSKPAAAPTRRERVVTTVGTSLGIGAIASILLAGWQLWDEHNRLEAERQRAFHEASSKVADTIAEARRGTAFSPELKLRLEALLGLAASPAGDARDQSLQTLAASLEPLCVALEGKDSSECRSYVASLRGQKEDGPLRQAMLQYWVNHSERRLVAQRPVMEVAFSVPTEAAPGEQAEQKAPPAAGGGPADKPAALPPSPDKRAAVASAESPAAGAGAPGGRSKAPVREAAPKAAAKAQAAPRPGPAQAPAAGAATQPAAPPLESVAARDIGKWTAAECAPRSKTGLTLYIHIYDERERPLAREIAQRAIDAGVAVPGIQNVVETAQRQSKQPPLRWRTITWLYRGDEGRRCAAAAQTWLASPEGRGRASQLVELPATLRAPPGIIELWLPASSVPPRSGA